MYQVGKMEQGEACGCWDKAQMTKITVSGMKHKLPNYQVWLGFDSNNAQISENLNIYGDRWTEKSQNPLRPHHLLPLVITAIVSGAGGPVGLLRCTWFCQWMDHNQ